MATSPCPDSSGATSGSSAFRSVDGSTSMWAATSAELVGHWARSARPRPGWVSRAARTSRNILAQGSYKRCGELMLPRWRPRLDQDCSVSLPRL
ncbi:MAG: hypothetical protein ACRDND_06575 [Streptosporangiaceae bacterium]